MPGRRSPGVRGEILHLGIVHAMGRGLDDATLAIGAYRHARRISIEPSGIYLFMDRAVAVQFDRTTS